MKFNYSILSDSPTKSTLPVQLIVVIKLLYIYMYVKSFLYEFHFNTTNCWKFLNNFLNLFDLYSEIPLTWPVTAQWLWTRPSSTQRFFISISLISNSSISSLFTARFSLLIDISPNLWWMLYNRLSTSFSLWKDWLAIYYCVHQCIKYFNFVLIQAI
jgi:hypothetical protein